MRSVPSVFPVLLSLFLVLSSACSTTTTPSSGSVVVDREPDYEETAPATSPVPPPPAQPASASPYAQLLDRAAAARGQGQYDQALALLERAHRIDPDSAEIYLNLAMTHRARGDQAQARATAERGLLYCSGSTECNALRAYTR